MAKYQGKEFTTTLQAPNKAEMDKMVRSTKAYAHKHGMETVKVLQKGKDPDGGYRAVVVAHNFNPLKLFTKGGRSELKVERREKREAKRARLKIIGTGTPAFEKKVAKEERKKAKRLEKTAEKLERTKEEKELRQTRIEAQRRDILSGGEFKESRARRRAGEKSRLAVTSGLARGLGTRIGRPSPLKKRVVAPRRREEEVVATRVGLVHPWLR